MHKDTCNVIVFRNAILEREIARERNDLNVQQPEFIKIKYRLSNSRILFNHALDIK